MDTWSELGYVNSAPHPHHNPQNLKLRPGDTWHSTLCADNGSETEAEAMFGTHTCQNRDCWFEEKERKIKQMQGAAGTRDYVTLRREIGRLGLTHIHYTT